MRKPILTVDVHFITNCRAKGVQTCTQLPVHIALRQQHRLLHMFISAPDDRFFIHPFGMSYYIMNLRFTIDIRRPLSLMLILSCQVSALVCNSAYNEFFKDSFQHCC